MPKSTPLTLGAIKAAIKAAVPRKLYDGGGLHLAITKAGSALWRMDVRYEGRPLLLSFGRFPDLDIEEARGLRSVAKAALKAGRDPRGPKPVVGDTFGAYADAHIARLRELGRASKTLEGHERFLGPTGHARALRPVPVGAITPMDVVACLRPFDGQETGRKLKQAVSMVFDDAIVAGAITVNPCAAIGKKQLKPPKETKHRPAVTDEDDFGALLESIASYRGDRLGVVKAAMQLLTLTALRPGELRLSRWPDVDTEEKIWTIGAERHKMRKPHVIPLCDRAVEILEALRERTGGEGWVFPSPRDPDKPMSTNGVNAALTALGYAGVHCGHGFRSSFKSLAKEARVGKGQAKTQRWNPDAIKRQMSHAVGDGDPVEQAYDRSPYWAERVEMAEWWSRKCDQLERRTRMLGSKRYWAEREARERKA